MLSQWLLVSGLYKHDCPVPYSFQFCLIIFIVHSKHNEQDKDLCVSGRSSRSFGYDECNGRCPVVCKRRTYGHISRYDDLYGKVCIFDDSLIEAFSKIFNFSEADKYLYETGKVRCDESEAFKRRARSLLVVASTPPTKNYGDFTDMVRQYNAYEPFNFLIPPLFFTKNISKV